MRYAAILGVFLLVACQSKPIPELSAGPEEAPVRVIPKPVVVAIPSDPIAAVAVLPPSQLKVAASKSLNDADHYVAWDRSRKENIDSLVPLTQHLADAVELMVAHHNKPADVKDVRKTLKDLRVFLRTKGD